MRIKPTVLGTVGAAALFMTAACGSEESGQASEDVPEVAILNLANVPSLTDIVDGLMDGLADAGYSESAIRVDSQNANGDLSVAQSIAAKFADDDPDVIATITTPALQAAINGTRNNSDVPIVFGAVSDPVAAGAVESLEGATGTNITGTYNVNPIPDVLDLAIEMIPDLDSVGILYNPGEDNSVADAAVMKSEAEARGLSLVEATADNSNNVQTAVQSIVGEVGVIILMQDSTVATAQAVVNKVAREERVPVLAFDATLVDKGAVAGLGRDAHDLGRQMAEQIVEILEGADPGEIPLQPQPPAELVVNQDAARETGFTIPPDVLNRAAEL